MATHYPEEYRLERSMTPTEYSQVRGVLLECLKVYRNRNTASNRRIREGLVRTRYAYYVHSK